MKCFQLRKTLILEGKMLHSEWKDRIFRFDDVVSDAYTVGFQESSPMCNFSQLEDLSFGVSPTHSLDSGVDNIEEYLFDFENKSCFSNDLWEEEHSDDNMVDVTNDLCSLGLRKEDESKSNLRMIKKSKLEETIEEDHCYTSKRFGSDSLDSKTTIDVLEVGMQCCQDNQVLLHKANQIARQASAEKENNRFMKSGCEDPLEGMTLRSTSDRCNNRNAVMARLNRERKKRYVSNLESEVGTLRKQNTSLLEENQNLKTNVSKCREELAYLRNVLENQSMLSSVIQAVSGIPGVNLKGIVNASSGKNKIEEKTSTSLDKDTYACGHKKQKLQNEENYIGKDTSQSFSSKQSGVCLHVQQENVSIQFCHYCSAHATS